MHEALGSISTTGITVIIKKDHILIYLPFKAKLMGFVYLLSSLDKFYVSLFSMGNNG
jgi:hypothetical protein